MGGTESSPRDPARSRLEARIARALDHDLRTPLGTIVNCAALFEVAPAPDAAALRDATARIRRQVAAVADAASLLGDALRTAARPGESRRGEPVALLRALADEIGAGVKLRARTTAAATDAIALEPRLVGFAWRAFLAAERSVRSPLPSELELVVARVAERVAVEIGFDGALEAKPAYGPVGAWANGGGARLAPLARLGLEVAAELFAVHGGTLEVAGEPGRRPALRLVWT